MDEDKASRLEVYVERPFVYARLMNALAELSFGGAVVVEQSKVVSPVVIRSGGDRLGGNRARPKVP